MEGRLEGLTRVASQAGAAVPGARLWVTGVRGGRSVEAAVRVDQPGVLRSLAGFSRPSGSAQALRREKGHRSASQSGVPLSGALKGLFLNL